MRHRQYDCSAMRRETTRTRRVDAIEVGVRPALNSLSWFKERGNPVDWGAAMLGEKRAAMA